MPSLKEVKNRITSVISTQQITKAMKMVAAAKLRKSQERITQMRPYAQKLTALFQNLSAAGQDEQAWYSKQRSEEKVLLVVISSDRGLCGSFNSTIIKAAIKLTTEKYSKQYAKGNLTILPLGKKVFEYFSKRNFKMESSYWNIFHGLSYEGVAQVGEFLMDEFKAGRYDKIEIVYNEFKNVATQILRTEQFLPVLPVVKEKSSHAEVDYIYMPNQEEIVTGLVPKALKIQLFKAVLDSNAAENGARMTAMDKATENAGELLKDLKLSYNRTRQAAITKEILEIVGGAEALKAS
ncbi:MAG TPA: ATP synthase F1 subunit gamma [Cyclobacteriaceae bacterium]|nr:ATP synthase F1 subunit gamma [Cyclobacteriaceae bacterium]